MDTLRPYLKLSTIFVKDMDRRAGRDECRVVLERMCPAGKGNVAVPVEYGGTKILGTAYLNFYSESDAADCLKKYQFKVIIRGHQAKMMYAADDRDKVYGPYSYKFQIIIDNLSEEVDEQTLRDKFAQYGDILQVKCGFDDWDQHFGQVQFIDEESVYAAIDDANGKGWLGAVMQVKIHSKAHLADQYKPSTPPAPRQQSPRAPMPVTPNTAAASGASSSAWVQPRLSGGTAAGAAPQQQQQQQQQREESALDRMYREQQAALAAGAQVPTQQHAQAAAAGTPINFAVQAMLASTATVAPPLPTPAAAAAAPATTQAPAPVPVPVPVPVPTPVPVPVPVSAAPAAASPGLPAGFTLFDMLTRSSAAVGAAAGRPAAPGAAGVGPANGEVGPQPAQVQTAAAAPVIAAAAVMANGSPVSGRAVTRPVAKAAAGSGALRAVLRSAAAKMDGVMELLTCPISHAPFEDPVVAADGFTYERADITQWLTSSSLSPMTGQTLPHAMLLPNTLTKKLIAELLG